MRLSFEKLLDGDVVIFGVGDTAFILQRYYQKERAENFMVQLMVDSKMSALDQRVLYHILLGGCRAFVVDSRSNFPAGHFRSGLGRGEGNEMAALSENTLNALGALLRLVLDRVAC